MPETFQQPNLLALFSNESKETKNLKRAQADAIRRRSDVEDMTAALSAINTGHTIRKEDAYLGREMISKGVDAYNTLTGSDMEVDHTKLASENTTSVFRTIQKGEKIQYQDPNTLKISTFISDETRPYSMNITSSGELSGKPIKAQSDVLTLAARQGRAQSQKDSKAMLLKAMDITGTAINEQLKGLYVDRNAMVMSGDHRDRRGVKTQELRDVEAKIEELEGSGLGDLMYLASLFEMPASIRDEMFADYGRQKQVTQGGQSTSINVDAVMKTMNETGVGETTVGNGLYLYVDNAYLMDKVKDSGKSEAQVLADIKAFYGSQGIHKGKRVRVTRVGGN